MSGPHSVIPYPHVNGKPIARKKRSTSPFSAAPPMTISRKRPPKTATSFSRIFRWRIRLTGGIFMRSFVVSFSRAGRILFA